MKCANVSILLVIGLGASPYATAQELRVERIHSHMDIYRAGGYDDGSDGIPPAVYIFSPHARQALVFSSVTGDWECEVGQVPYGADGSGTGGCYGPLGMIISDPVGPFSGYQSTNFLYALVGMFLEDTLPATPPAPLHFIRGESNSPGEIATDFTILTPAIGQVFFIGDGLTHSGFGQHQIFAVPPTATHLYLAFIDSCAQFGQPGVPGCYSDNGGMLTAAFKVDSSEEIVGGFGPEPLAK